MTVQNVYLNLKGYFIHKCDIKNIINFVRQTTQNM